LVYGAGQGIKHDAACAITATTEEDSMALTMSDKQAAQTDRSEWPAALKKEFAREARSPNGDVGNELVSETDKIRVWTIRLKPGQRFGFHRHVLNYFWTAITACRGRQHLMDGTTVEYTYAPGETRHESYGPGEFKVHDLENIGDSDMVFMTVEFRNGANTPLAIPDAIRRKAA
jgi:beta-alanine degradation protein BauB